MDTPLSVNISFYLNPSLCISITQGHWLYWSGAMTIKIKQAQLKERLRAESKLRKQRRESQIKKESEQAPNEAEQSPETDNHAKTE